MSCFKTSLANVLKLNSQRESERFQENELCGLFSENELSASKQLTCLEMNCELSFQARELSLGRERARGRGRGRERERERARGRGRGRGRERERERARARERERERE